MKAIEVKEATSFADSFSALLFLYEGIRSYYSTARHWIAKVGIDLTQGDKDARRVFIATYGEDIVGVMVLKPCEAKICSLYIAPRFKGVGIVRQFFDYILTEDSYWYIEVPLQLKDDFAFLVKYFGFEYVESNNQNCIYQYGSFSHWYNKQQKA